MKVNFILLSLILAMTIGCSSGGSGGSGGGKNYSGTPSIPSIPGTPSDPLPSEQPQNNEPPEDDEIALAMVHTAIDTINSNNAPDLDIPLGEKPAPIQSDIATYIETIPFSATTGHEEIQHGNCGGTLTTTSASHTVSGINLYPFEIKTLLVYKGYCHSGTIITNGFVESTIYNETSTNYTSIVSYDLHSADTSSGATFSMKNSQTCSVSDSNKSCTDGVWYRSESGRSYTLNDSKVKRSTDFYEITGTFVISGTNATYTYSAQNLMFCENGKFGTGTIEMHINNVLYIRVEFINCDQASYYVDGYSGMINY